jgi:hypothetical protein
MNPWLIEVNQAPSFNTDTPLDDSLKNSLLIDTFSLVGISLAEKNRKLNIARLEKEKRMLERGNLKKTLREKNEQTQMSVKNQEEHELMHLGNYERIFPPVDCIDIVSRLE